MNNESLTAAYSELEKLGAEYFTSHQATETSAPRLAKCFHKLVGSQDRDQVLVIGCGPKPQTIFEFESMGFQVAGVEPITAYVQSANAALGRHAVHQGEAELLPLPKESVRFVVMESVLEHVDSPINAFREIFRVLQPGGVAYIYTTNRFHFSPLGSNGEYEVPFYNWLPKVVKESYVYWHMHKNPGLANFTPRPAVHWFCYTDLCELGRQAGFFLFYSLLDVIDPTDPAIARSSIRKLALRAIRANVWIRALSLLQFGNCIFMYKR